MRGYSIDFYIPIRPLGLNFIELATNTNIIGNNSVVKCINLKHQDVETDEMSSGFYIALALHDIVHRHRCRNSHVSC
jgi:hypothetical protein